MTKWLGLFFLTISTYLVKSQNLVESPAKEVVEISSSEVLIDTSGKYTFEDISTGKYKFMPLSTTSSTNPIHNTIYWVRFRISSKSNQKMAIIQTARSNQVLMYIPLDSIHYEVQKSGFNYTFSERNVYHNEHIFIIPVLTGERDHYYIKIISGNNFGIYIAPYSIPTYTSKTFKEALYYGFFFGIIFLAVLYSLVMYFRIREDAYLFYALYVFNFGLFATMDWGFIVQIPGISSLGWNKNFYTIPFVAMTCFLLLYARSFLDTKDNLPFYHRLLTILVYARIALYFVGLITDLNIFYNPINDDIFLLGAFAAGFVRLRQGYVPSKYFLVAFSVAYIGFFFHAFNWYFKIIPVWVINSLGLYNTGISEIILFSFGLAERFRYLKREKDESSIQTIRYLEENNQLKDDAILQLKENISLKEDVQKAAKDRVMQKRVTFDEFRQIYPDEVACFKFVEELKWGKGFVCKKCGNAKFSKGNTEYSRRCSKCNSIEQLYADTLFSGIKFPITKAFYMLFLVSSGKNTTVDELSSSLDLRKQTCWAFRKKLEMLIATRKTKHKNKDGWSFLILMEQ